MFYIVLANAINTIDKNHVEHIFNTIDDFMYHYARFIFGGKEKSLGIFSVVYNSDSEFKEIILCMMKKTDEILLYNTDNYYYTLHIKKIYCKFENLRITLE